jgi:hypothetical protein
MSAPKLKVVSGGASDPQRWAAIPAELRDRAQWVVWKLEPVAGRPKPAKMPYCAPGRRASTTDPGTWLTFDAAVQLAADGFDGIGFVFTSADPYVGVDFDERTPATTALVAALDSYTERSQSGRGEHVIVRGAIPRGRKKGAVEMYDRERFFVMTGDVVGERRTIADRSVQVATVYAEAFDGADDFVRPLADGDGKRRLPRRHEHLTDDDLLALIAQQDEDAYAKYFDGELPPLPTGAKRDESKDDAALVHLLIRYVGWDEDRIAALCERSTQQRKKWADRRPDGGTWLGYTIRRRLRAAAAKAPAPIATTPGPLDVTAAELATNPDLLTVPASASAWLVWRGDLTMLVGREKLAGKTTLAASDATRAAQAGLTVLWVTAEESLNRVVKRFADLGAPLDRVILLRRWPQSWEEVEAVIAARRPDAIYVDSVASFLMAVDGGVPDNSEGEKWQGKMLRFKAWATRGQPDAGVCVLKHATKADGTYAGSVGIGAGPDTIITMRELDKADPTGRWLETIGRWSFPSRGVRFAGDAKGYVDATGVTPATTGPKLTKERRRILDLLPATGLTWAAWWAAYEAAQGSKTTFSNALIWFQEQGLVVHDGEAGMYRRKEFDIGQTPGAAA